MIETAKGNADAPNNVQYHIGSADKLPFIGDAEVDLVVSATGKYASHRLNSGPSTARSSLSILLSLCPDHVSELIDAFVYDKLLITFMRAGGRKQDE